MGINGNLKSLEDFKNKIRKWDVTANFVKTLCQI